MSDENLTAKKRGRPRATGQEIRVTFRLRRGRLGAEDALMDRLSQLTPGQRSRFIRRVLTTGELEPVLEREFARESERVSSALNTMITWDDEDED